MSVKLGSEKALATSLCSFAPVCLFIQADLQHFKSFVPAFAYAILTYTVGEEQTAHLIWGREAVDISTHLFSDEAGDKTFRLPQNQITAVSKPSAASFSSHLKLYMYI